MMMVVTFILWIFSLLENKTKTNQSTQKKPPDNQKKPTNKQQNTMKAHSDAHSVFEPGFGLHRRPD